MDEMTAGQLLGVAPYTIRKIEHNGICWLVTVRDMCSHADTVRELPREKATGGIVTGTAYLVGDDGGPAPFVAPARNPGGPVGGTVRVVLEDGEQIVRLPAKPKGRKPKANP